MRKAQLTLTLGVAILVAVFGTLISSGGVSLAMERCDFESGRSFDTCVVDGDTIWVSGINYRLAGFDTPEGHRNLCGGARERQLAEQATDRLIELMNANEWTVTSLGSADRFGRVLANLSIAGRDAGAILVEERLARFWPDGEEWWCE